MYKERISVCVVLRRILHILGTGTIYIAVYEEIVGMALPSSVTDVQDVGSRSIIITPTAHPSQQPNEREGSVFFQDMTSILFQKSFSSSPPIRNKRQKRAIRERGGGGGQPKGVTSS